LVYKLVHYKHIHMNMRRYYCIIVLLIIWGSYSQAQTSSLVIDAPDNEQFTIMVNGYHQSYNPGARIEIRGLVPSKYKIEVVFKDSFIQPVVEHILVTEKTEQVYSVECFKSNDENADKVYEIRYATTRQLPTNYQFDPELIDGYLEQSKTFIHGPNSTEENSRSIVVSWDSDDVVIKDEATEYPIEVNLDLIVYKKTIIGSNCPSTVSTKNYNEIIALPMQSKI